MGLRHPIAATPGSLGRHPRHALRILAAPLLHEPHGVRAPHPPRGLTAITLFLAHRDKNNATVALRTNGVYTDIARMK